MQGKFENRLSSTVSITKYAQGQEKYYKLDKTQDWLEKLLKELNEKADEKTPEEYLSETSLDVELTLKKIFNSQEGEILLCKAQLDAHYVTQCIRTLEPMHKEFSLEIKACFLDGVLQAEDAYEDQLETFQDGDTFDLYFHDNKIADLAKMTHEQVFLNLDQYPVKDPDTELVWAKESGETKQ